MKQYMDAVEAVMVCKESKLRIIYLLYMAPHQSKETLEDQTM